MMAVLHTKRERLCEQISSSCNWITHRFGNRSRLNVRRRIKIKHKKRQTEEEGQGSTGSLFLMIINYEQKLTIAPLIYTLNGFRANDVSCILPMFWRVRCWFKAERFPNLNGAPD